MTSGPDVVGDVEVAVEAPGGSYPVVVGRGARCRVAGLLPTGVRRAAVVTQDAVPWTVETGVEQKTFTIPAGEAAKDLVTIDGLCRAFACWGLTRRDVVIGVGGGVVTDVAGFAAAVYHRGTAVVHVATTLLAQVDAAIGGKTGVNLPEGKNLVGAFWAPSAVICDTETLDTLPAREWAGGHGEMAKYAFLGVEDLPGMPVERAVAACVAAKAAFVAEDEREDGRRALLNYGHTLAHALETTGAYDLRHGEAVAVGLAFAARLARRLDRVDDARVADHDRLLAGYGLGGRLPPGADIPALLGVMGRDKKAVSGGLTFILDGPAGPEVVPDVPADLVARVLEELRP